MLGENDATSEYVLNLCFKVHIWTKHAIYVWCFSARAVLKNTFIVNSWLNKGSIKKNIKWKVKAKEL